ISYDPVRDESGNVSGVCCIVSETSGRVVGERRLRILRDLGRATLEARTADEVFMDGASVLAAANLDIGFALAYTWDHASGRARRAFAVNVQPGTPWAPGLLDENGPWPIADLESGGCLIEERELAHLGALPGGACPERAKHVMILPIDPPG